MKNLSLDLAIRNARAVHADAEVGCDIGISGGRIAQISAPGTLGARAVVDAEGLHVLPGLVDAHAHLREPGIVHKEGFQSGTLAAAAGGVTTVMVMPTDNPVTLTPAQFEDKRRLAQGQCHVDFALQAALGTDPSHVPELARLGAISFEIFLADVPETFLVRDAESLLAAMAAVARVGAIAGITPGDHDVVLRRTTEIRARSKGAREDFPPTRPPISEALGIARACVAARETGASIHIRQVSCEAGVQVIRAMREGIRLTAEVTPHNLTLDESELIRQGPVAKVAPPLRPRSDVTAVLDALRGQTIDIVATDHAPHLPAEKAKGAADIWQAPGGLIGLQTFLPVMLGLVERGQLTLSDVVRTCATAPASIFGLGHKGRIAVGADADLLLVDMKRSTTIRNEDQLSKAASTPFAGQSVKGALAHTFLRGIEIARDGKPCAPPMGNFQRQEKR
jgi:dihydroorotase